MERVGPPGRRPPARTPDRWPRDTAPFRFAPSPGACDFFGQHPVESPGGVIPILDSPTAPPLAISSQPPTRERPDRARRPWGGPTIGDEPERWRFSRPDRVSHACPGPLTTSGCCAGSAGPATEASSRPRAAQPKLRQLLQRRCPARAWRGRRPAASPHSSTPGSLPT
jgi:hypothetical protein